MARECNLCLAPIASLYFSCGCADEYSICPQCACPRGIPQGCPTTGCGGFSFSFQAGKQFVPRLLLDLDAVLTDVDIPINGAAPPYAEVPLTAAQLVCDGDRLSLDTELHLRRLYTLQTSQPAVLQLPGYDPVRSWGAASVHRCLRQGGGYTDLAG